MTIKFALQILGIYIFANVLVWLVANKQIFLPPASTYKDSAAILKLPVEGQYISALYLHNPKAKFTIIYSHGNAEDLGMIEPILQEISSWGFSVIGYDYRGYGTSEGFPSEHTTYKDIEAVYQYLTVTAKIDPTTIIVWGRSLGSGPSVNLAAHHPIAGLILESPMLSAYRVITYYPFFFPDKYNNLAKLNSIHVPILFMHGELDRVIPIWHSKKLFDSYQGEKYHHWLPNVGHNDIDYFDSRYKKNVLDFSLNLTKPKNPEPDQL